MTDRIFRPFWSYDVKKTENWLHGMALKGYQLKRFHTITRIFVFEQNNECQDVRYHIEYTKNQTKTIPAALLNNGWERIISSGKWYILKNEQPSEKRKSFPVRDGIIKRNRNMMYFFSGMFIYTLLTSLLFIIMCGLMLLFNYSITFQANIFWMTTLSIGVVLWALSPYSAIKLYKTNQRYW